MPTSRPRSADCAWSRGVVLLDVVIALAIVGLLSLVLLPHLPTSTGPSRLNAHADRIVALLRADRFAALRQQRAVTTQVDVQQRRVRSGQAQSGSRIALPRDVTIEYTGSRLCAAPPGSVGVTFFWDGRSCGAVLVLRTEQHRVEIAVNWFTGSVETRRGRT